MSLVRNLLWELQKANSNGEMLLSKPNTITTLSLMAIWLPLKDPSNLLKESLVEQWNITFNWPLTHARVTVVYGSFQLKRKTSRKTTQSQISVLTQIWREPSTALRLLKSKRTMT
jgi:hypothetical protein